MYDIGIFGVYSSPVPTISIGNITVGGTGKTPMAAYLMAHLSRHHPQLNIAYLSRGYGRNTQGFIHVNPHQDTAERVGDEALLIAYTFPEIHVVVCESRKIGIQRLVDEYDVKLVILDDAFQHRKVSRNLDWIMIDATRFPINDELLPSGRLREPTTSLRRSNVLIINKIQTPAQAIPSIQNDLRAFGKPLVFANAYAEEIRFFSGKKSLPISDLAQAPVILFSGIGNPHFFNYQVEKLGANVCETFDFRDHHAYQKADIQKLVDAFNAQKNSTDLLLLTTEKDYFRMKGTSLVQAFGNVPVAYITIRMKILQGEDILVRQLNETLPSLGL